MLPFISPQEKPPGLFKGLVTQAADLSEFAGGCESTVLDRD